MLALDFYPEGHQGGVGIIHHGRRIATNGDLRLEPAPGQWAPIPKVGERRVDRQTGLISIGMSYPDETKHRKGFNPIEYPDLHFSYSVSVRPEGEGFLIQVDLDEPLAADWIGRIGFNLELFPGYLIGRSFATESSCGIFPAQGAVGEPTAGDEGVPPFATGKSLVIAPESELDRLHIVTRSGGELRLIDGRARHNNGWFVVRELVEAGATNNAVVWHVSASHIEGWRREPVIQLSQVGYHPAQPKRALVELDGLDCQVHAVKIQRIQPDGRFETVAEGGADWGKFLRYRYLELDFSEVTEPGMYRAEYGDVVGSVFQISESVYERHVWQPTVDRFLPVQMCHMRVTENYRVWHGACHLDDAQMAPTNLNHFDGYVQGPSTLSRYESGQDVPGLNVGGWHDAGDYDLRIESQSDTVHGLALAYEEFRLAYDNTTIDQATGNVELLRPDGIPDILQQIEHGCLSIVVAYKSLGCLYRGIIEPTLEQYTLLGDPVVQTENTTGGSDNCRWVFTEENPRRRLRTAAALAACSRVLGELNPRFAIDCKDVGLELYRTDAREDPDIFLPAAVEQYLAIKEPVFLEQILSAQDKIVAQIDRLSEWAARSLAIVPDERYQAAIREALAGLAARNAELALKTPYGVPYEPNIWGAGWQIQRFGVEHYWLNKHSPDLFPAHYVFDSLNFILGCHPGVNPVSFVSGVGARSMMPGYGVNRADFSYIPGGVGSGTALIRPDFPELLEWPYLWQQTEYCLGHPTSDFVFLVNAADRLAKQGSS